MSLNRGVVANYKSSAARTISIKSTHPIALVLTADSSVEPKMYYFDSIKEALAKFQDANGGNLLKYLQYGEDLYALIVPMVVSVVTIDEDKATEKSRVIEAVNRLALAPSHFGVRPDIIGVGDWSSDEDVQNALVSTADKLKARSFVDLDATNNAEAKQSRDNLGSSRITPAFTNLMNYNPKTNETEEYSSSIALAFLRSSIDGSNNIGYSYSISNRVIPVSGIKENREFLPGFQDETDFLTDNQITSYIRYKGIRVWNYQTCDIDAMWQDARRVRIFDLACFAVIDGIFYAVDKDLSALESAQDTLRGFMNDLVGADVMLGFNVYLDKERTTETAITAGKFYFIIECQETPSPVRIEVTFDRVNKYANVVYERLS